MSVYDKELIIDGKAVRSPEQQVYKNMKDIKELQEVIVSEKEYYCNIDLLTSATTVAKSYTNADESVKSGWLYDPHANKFKITGGDDTNLLIEFYTSLRGPQGESGASAIDDSTTSATKVWSSNKVNTEVGNAKDKGIYYTTTQPTYDSGTGFYTLDEGHFDNQDSDIPIKAFDLLLYIDSNDKVKEVYKVLNKVGNNWTLDKIGDVGGKQLYDHNIRMYVGPTTYVRLTIRNDDNTPMNNYDTIKNYLSSHLFTSWDTCRECSGIWTSGTYIWGMYADGNIIKVCANDSAQTISNTATISDHPVAL